MLRIIGLIRRPVSKGDAFQEMTLVISKLKKKCGEFFQNKPKYFLNHKDA